MIWFNKNGIRTPWGNLYTHSERERERENHCLSIIEKCKKKKNNKLYENFPKVSKMALSY